MESISSFITKKLKLKVNGEKSAVAKVGERGFLGFSFLNRKEPKQTDCAQGDQAVQGACPGVDAADSGI